MSAFVLGATGFVGREVVRQLCVRGTQTYAHVRSGSKARDKVEGLGAEIDTTNWSTDALAARWKAVKPAQIYICIGTTRGRAKTDGVDGDIYEKIDFGLTAMTVEAAQQSGAKPRLVYLSSLGADATARSAYLKARGRAEDAITHSGLSYGIARPAIITGDRDESRAGERVGAVVGDGVLAVVGLFSRKVKQKYASTTPDVLAAALIRLGSLDENVVADGDQLR